jgi:hypothetical protein
VQLLLYRVVCGLPLSIGANPVAALTQLAVCGMQSSSGHLAGEQLPLVLQATSQHATCSSIQARDHDHATALRHTLSWLYRAMGHRGVSFCALCSWKRMKVSLEEERVCSAR